MTQEINNSSKKQESVENMRTDCPLREKTKQHKMKPQVS